MKYLLSTAFAILCCSAVHAAGDAVAGKGKAATCIACHGANGVAITASYPNLAGQNAEYMVNQLKAFKSGARKGAQSAIMAPMAAGLSEQDMMDVAAYFASLAPAN